MPNTYSREEYNRGYSKTYVGWITPNKIIPYNVQAVVQGKSLNHMVFQGYRYEEGTWIPQNAELKELTLDYPQCGVINHKEWVIYIKRDPRRQYSQGFPEQYSRLVSNPSRDLCDTLKMDPDTVDLTNLFNPYYYSPLEAIKLVNEGNALARAVSNKLFVTISAFEEDLGLFYKEYKIGVIKDTKVYLHPSVLHLTEEVGTYFEVVNNG